MTYLSEEMEPQSLGFAMGLYISGNTVGGLFGRISVETITDLSSWRWAIGVLAMISLLASIYFWRRLPASHHFSPRTMQPKEVLSLFIAQFHDKGLVCLFILGGVLMGGFVTMYNYLGYSLSEAPYHLSQTILGWIFILYLVGTFSSTFMGKLSDRIGRSKVLWINLALMLLGIIVTLSSHLFLRDKQQKPVKPSRFAGFCCSLYGSKYFGCPRFTVPCICHYVTVKFRFMRDQQNTTLISFKRTFQLILGINIKMVGRFVKHKQIRITVNQLAQTYLGFFATA
ncbi:Inner membrane transport protein YnfM [compost metagenome]